MCAALPGGDPNHVTDDFAAHLTLEHRAPRDFISFQFQPIFLRSEIFVKTALLSMFESADIAVPQKQVLIMQK